MDNLAQPLDPVKMFLEAQADFEEQVGTIQKAMLSHATRREELSALNNEFKEREAQLLLSGEIEGSNETQRKAALALLMRDDPQAEGLRKKASKKQAQLDTASADLELARLRISSAKARRNMALVYLGWLTAQQGDRWAVIDEALGRIQDELQREAEKLRGLSTQAGEMA